MDKKIQVFVSSTYKDLKEERQAAVEAILKAGQIPAGMELFTAGDQSQLEVIKRWIDESDAFLLILGGRYGSIESTTSLSYIELEYDYAVSIEKPLFAIVITEDALVNKIKEMGDPTEENENPKKLVLFRKKVLNKMSSFFADKKDIKLAIHESLSDMLQRNEFSGWIRGNTVADNNVLLNEINLLKNENIDLKTKLSHIQISTTKTRKPTKNSDDYYEELLKIFKGTIIKTTIFNSDEKDEPIDVPLDLIITTYRDQLVVGVKNRFDSKKIDSFLFFSILPKLEIHGLAAQEKVTGVQWKNYKLSEKGLQFIAYLERKKQTSSKSDKA